MKLLILGNHTCGNRGDSAILRGLLDAINTLEPETEVDVMSRYPVSSSWLLNRPVMGDPLYSQMKQHNNVAGVMGRVKKVLRRRYQHQVLLSRVTDTGKLRNIAIAQGFTDFVRLLSGYDAIIQVGGSFFVDLYGVPQFEHALCTFMAKKPLFMIGHSVGPFQDPQFNQLANYVFAHCDALILRESVSLNLMKRSDIDTSKVEHGVDTAWLVDHQDDRFQQAMRCSTGWMWWQNRKPLLLPCASLRHSTSVLARPRRHMKKPSPEWLTAYWTAVIRCWRSLPVPVSTVITKMTVWWR
jgi:colanic acid/amylovoran biosynthesis protein